MPRPERQCLRALMLARGTAPRRFIADAMVSLPLAQAGILDRLRGDAAEWRGRSVLIRTRRQLPAVLAALALDGVARRILLCPPNITDTQLPEIMRDGAVDAVATDDDVSINLGEPAPRSRKGEYIGAPESRIDTEWVLFTSGTSGAPKLVLHSLASLTYPLRDGVVAEHGIWSTFYDIRRYGGLQILLRALAGGGSMILADDDEHAASFLARLGAAGVTHISGTPSHWRRALMSRAARGISPAYVRLSGEVVGQDILDHLRQTYPDAVIAHAFASTEAGLAFDVRDGIAGFPAHILGAAGNLPQIKIDNGTIRIRSGCAAIRYLGAPARCLADRAGFVDTGDIVELRDGRYHFLGRREGVINVGGLKVHPEEVEAVINRHPCVLMSRVWGRASPITGTLMAADVVLRHRPGETMRGFALIRAEIIAACRDALVAHKVPVRVNEVADIPVLASGKIARHHA